MCRCGPGLPYQSMHLHQRKTGDRAVITGYVMTDCLMPSDVLS